MNKYTFFYLKKQIYLYLCIYFNNLNMKLSDIILESTEEQKILDFLKHKIKGTEWENRVFLAGGAVRDEIMGKHPKDLDFLIDGELSAGIDFSIWLGKELGEYKKDSNPVIFPRYGTSKLSISKNKHNLPNIDLEFVAPRKEKYTKGSRKPIVSGGKLMDDVLRRDLSINSLLKNITTDEILDLTGKGINDIKKGIIRTTSDPEIIFKEDPLRLIRTIRFMTKYNFKITKSTYDNIVKNAELINTISKERVKDELNKILEGNNPSKGINLLRKTGLLKYIIGEFNDTIGMTQNIHHNQDVFQHSLSVLKNTPPDLKTRLMALFHDIGKVLTKTVSPDGSVHFYGHEDASEKMVKDIMFRLKYPNELINAVATGVKHHMDLKHGDDDASKISDKSLRKFVTAVGENLTHILDLIHADNISHSDESSMKNQINNVRQRIDKLNSQVNKSNFKLPINGDDLIALGMKPSQQFREILQLIQDAWYDNPNITRDDAMKIVDMYRSKITNNINEIKSIINSVG